MVAVIRGTIQTHFLQYPAEARVVQIFEGQKSQDVSFPAFGLFGALGQISSNEQPKLHNHDNQIDVIEHAHPGNSRAEVGRDGILNRHSFRAAQVEQDKHQSEHYGRQGQENDPLGHHLVTVHAEDTTQSVNDAKARSGNDEPGVR